VSTIRIQRPKPGMTGQLNPPTITVHTVLGDVITVHLSVATVADAAGVVKHTLSAAAGIGNRRRRMLGAENSTQPTDHEDGGEEEEEPFAVSPLTRFPLQWTLVPESSHRSLQEDDDSFVRRQPSNTSFGAFLFAGPSATRDLLFHVPPHASSIGFSHSAAFCG
jgi:hypothetical protein